MKRKYIFRFFILSLVAFGHGSFLKAQSEIKLLLNQATLGVGIGADVQEVADRQLLSLLSDGEGVNHEASAFMIQPAFDLIEEGKIEGIKSRQTAKINLQLKLVHLFTAEVLEVQDILLVGSGESARIAINKAIRTARRANPVLQKQLAAMRESAANYLVENCSAFIDGAKDFAGQGAFHEAFALLHAVPPGSECYERVADNKHGYFLKWQETTCATELHKARAAEAQNDFSEALSILSSLDANAPCFSEAKSAILAIESKVDSQLKQDYEWMFKFYKEGKEAETARWNAMNNLFLVWLRNNGNYESLVQPPKN